MARLAKLLKRVTQICVKAKASGGERADQVNGPVSTSYLPTLHFQDEDEVRK